jgi:hypothetical protein
MNHQRHFPISAPSAGRRGATGMRNGMHRAVLAVATLAMAGFAMVGLATGAQANSSFTDGGFASFTGSSGQCSGNSSTNTQQVTNSDLPSWSVNSSYTFVLNSGNYQNFSNSFNGNSGSCIGLQAPVTSAGQGPITPPIGTNFLGIDPSFENNISGTNWSVAQIVTGLIPGTTYNLTFDMAAGQQTGFHGSSTDTWLVGLSSGTGGCATSNAATCAPNTGTTTSGSSQQITLNDLCSPNPPYTGGCGGGFSGWASAEVSLVASAAAEVLWFFGESTAASPQPPFLLLDGVSMSQQTTVPEPPAYGMLMVGVLVLLGARRVLRRKA